MGKERVGLIKGIFLVVSDRVIHNFLDPNARQRSMKEVLQARLEGREPAPEAVEHIRYMPGSAVKDILTGNKRRGR